MSAALIVSFAQGTADGSRQAASHRGDHMTDLNSATPEPDFGALPGTAMTPEQLAYQRSRRDELSRLAGRRLTVSRVVVGVVAALLAIGLGAGGVAELSIGIIGGAVLCFVLAVLCAWYCYRVWRPRARRRHV